MQKYFWGNNLDKSFSWNFLKTIAKMEGFWTRFTKFRVYGLANHQTSTWLQSFLLSYLSCSQIWLDPLLDGSQCGYTTKVKKKTLRITCWWYMVLSKPMSNLNKICKKIINMSMYWKSWYS
jgi:hypothetical protein